jgi:hypothetical protein
VTETVSSDESSSTATTESDPIDQDEKELSDVEALRIAREESRAVLNHRVEDINAMDDAALRIGRVAVVVLGIILSGAGLIGTSRITSMPAGVLVLFGSGVLILLITLLVSILTYTDSELDVGIDSTWREEVREEGYNEKEWLVTLLEGYDEWIGVLQQEQSANRFQLLMTQLLLVTALLVLLHGLAFLTWRMTGFLGLLLLVSGALALSGLKRNI